MTTVGVEIADDAENASRSKANSEKDMSSSEVHGKRSAGSARAACLSGRRASGGSGGADRVGRPTTQSDDGDSPTVAASGTFATVSATSSVAAIAATATIANNRACFGADLVQVDDVDPAAAAATTAAAAAIVTNAGCSAVPSVPSVRADGATRCAGRVNEKKCCDEENHAAWSSSAAASTRARTRSRATGRAAFRCSEARDDGTGQIDVIRNPRYGVRANRSTRGAAGTTIVATKGLHPRLAAGAAVSAAATDGSTGNAGDRCVVAGPAVPPRDVLVATDRALTRRLAAASTTRAASVSAVTPIIADGACASIPQVQHPCAEHVPVRVDGSRPGDDDAAILLVRVEGE